MEEICSCFYIVCNVWQKLKNKKQKNENINSTLKEYWHYLDAVQKGHFSCSWYALLMLTTHQYQQTRINYLNLILKFPLPCIWKTVLLQWAIDDMWTQSPKNRQNHCWSRWATMKSLFFACNTCNWQQPTELMRLCCELLSPRDPELCANALTYHYDTTPSKSKPKVGS